MAFIFSILIIIFSILAWLLKYYITDYIRINLLWSYLLWIIVWLILYSLWKTYKTIYKTYWYIILFIASLLYLLSYFIFSYYFFINSSKFDNFSLSDISNNIVTKENLFIKKVVNTHTTKDLSNSKEYRDLISNYSDVNIMKVSTLYPKYLLKIKSRLWQDLYFDYLTQFSLAIKLKNSIEKEDTKSLVENLLNYYDYLYQNTWSKYYLYMKNSVVNWDYSSDIFLTSYYWENSFYWYNIVWFVKYQLKDSVNLKLYKSTFDISLTSAIILEILEFITYFLWLITIIHFSFLKRIVKVDKRFDEHLEYRTNESLDKISINFNIFRNVSYYSDWEKFTYIIKLFLSKENTQDSTDLSAKLMFYENNKKMSLLFEKILQLDSFTYTSLINKLWIEQRVPQAEEKKIKDEFKIEWF